MNRVKYLGLKNLGMGITLSLTAAFALTTPAFSDAKVLDLEKIVSVEKLLSDAKTFRNGYFELHPAPYHNVSAEKLAAAFDHIEASIQEPMTVLEAWRLFSTVNPVMGDAHAGIIIPKRSTIIKERLKNGERVFPLSVYFNNSNRLYVKLDNQANSGLSKDTEILAINGRKTDDLVSEMLLHMRGDNVTHQRVLLERWFTTEYWALFGSSAQFKIAYADGNEVKEKTLPGQDTLPKLSSEKSFEDFFEYKILDNNIGYVRVDTFSKAHQAAFLAMTEKAFTEFKEKTVQNLIIDIRENGGGSNNLWQKGILPYIADKPYRHVSSYKYRVTEKNADPGEVVGEILSGVYNEMAQPDLDNPLFFNGETYLFIGNMTYSSSIHFAITAQDYELATLVGQPSGGRAGTTGNITDIILDGTGLDAFAPVILFSRPKGDANSSPVQPDILINHHPDNPEKDIQELLQQIGK